MAESPSTDADSRTDARDAQDTSDSSWWYWVAAIPIYYVVGTALGFVVGVASFAFALTGMGTMDPGPGMGIPIGWGLGFASVFVVVAVLAAAGILLSLLFPLAIYLDADAVAATGGEWEPDAVLYGLIGLVGVFAQPVQVPVGVYYLYRRHQATGVP
ncbi:hypothetical protein [Halobacterium sp. R2-5]|uniref:hypothetical protein n=1 Tax=Halobacterium sp. R2-5 TaxID=2715751 RepID=UPI001421F704|nr:hypothetical protein [Halobacterium sp. R2-5]NIB98078.1 hypothetical protein [Halobacterium sp. R2-5]